MLEAVEILPLARLQVLDAELRQHPVVVPAQHLDHHAVVLPRCIEPSPVRHRIGPDQQTELHVVLDRADHVFVAAGAEEHQVEPVVRLVHLPQSAGLDMTAVVVMDRAQCIDQRAWGRQRYPERRLTLQQFPKGIDLADLGRRQLADRGTLVVLADDDTELLELNQALADIVARHRKAGEQCILGDPGTGREATEYDILLECLDDLVVPDSCLRIAGWADRIVWLRCHFHSLPKYRRANAGFAEGVAELSRCIIDDTALPRQARSIAAAHWTPVVRGATDLEKPN